MEYYYPCGVDPHRQRHTSDIRTRGSSPPASLFPKQLFLALFLFCFVGLSLPIETYAQIIYEERFNEAGKGFTNSLQPPSNGQWTITGNTSSLDNNSSDYFRTAGGELVAQDVDNEVCFVTSTINISTYDVVNFTIDLSESGDMESSDYMDVEYRINGGSWTTITDWDDDGTGTRTLNDDWGSTQVGVFGLSGNSLQIRVCVDNNEGSENHSVDNVVVTGSANNPDLMADCPLKVVLVLDESGSIGSSIGAGVTGTVRDAAEAFVGSLVTSAFPGFEAQLAVIEFNSNARIVNINGSGTGYGTVNAAYNTAFGAYVNSNAQSGYNPDAYGSSDYWTNWEDAFFKITDVTTNTGTAPDYVLFFTDGNPTAYMSGSTAGSPGSDVTSGTDEAEIAFALSQAIPAANVVKNAGSHIFVLAVGDGLTDAQSELNIRAISGPDKDLGPGGPPPPNDPELEQADYAIISFDQLKDDIEAISRQLCGSELQVEKTISDDTPCDDGTEYTFTITVTDLDDDNDIGAKNVVVTDEIPSGYNFVSSSPAPTSTNGNTYTWNLGNINNEASEVITVTVTVNSSGDYSNTATAMADNTLEASATIEANEITIECEEADLELEKTVDNSTPNVGDNVVFTISVTNDGPSDATGVTVSDQLPTGYTYVSDNQGNDLADGTWNIGNLANGQTVSIEVTATVNASGIYENTAQVETANEPDPDSDPGNDDGDQSEDDEDAASVEPSAVADLELEKTVDNGTPNVGDNVVFTISVTNDGPSDATGVTVSDQLPTGYTYVSDNQGNDLADGTWNIGNLANGQTVSIEVTATVNASGIYENTAQVQTANEPDPDSDPGNDDGDQSEDDEDAASVEPSAVADLELEKTVDNGTPNVGDNVVFTISVTNDGPSDATGVTVSDQLPTGYTYVSDNQGNDLADGTWNIGNLANGQTVSIEVTATVNASGIYENTAQVETANEPDPDSDPGNDDGDQSEDDEDAASVEPSAVADLELEKTVDNGTPNVGDNVVFTISVTNDGPSDATGVTVSDQLPTGYTYVSDNQGNDLADGTWNIGNLANGQTVSIEVTATVNASGIYENTAQVETANEPDPDSDPGNDDGDQSEDDEDAASVEPSAVADLELEKTVDNGTPNVGDNVVFTISVTNDGPSDATGVTVSDQLPTGYTYVSDNQGNDLADGTWNIGNLANGQTVSIEVTATVNASGIYENTAQVETANEPDPDSDPGNDDGDQSEDDEDAASVEPSAVADLELEKTVDNGTPNVGDNVVFTISVTNDGPSDATGVTVSDQLPTGYTYVSDNQGNDLADGTWNIGNLANGQTVSIEVTATVNASGIYENTAQVETANEPDPDSDPGNDDGDQSEDDEDAASVEPSAVADLELEKTVDNGTPNVGDNVVFTISVTNDGPSDATGVTVSDQLPTGYTYVSDNQGNDLADGTWNIGNLANGQTVSIEVTATVNASGIYENTAQVETANEPDPDSDPGNDDGDQSEDDEDAASVEPSAVADLELEKTVDNGTPNVGDNVVFTISVTNDGPSDATGVTVSDQLPTGYTYVSDNQGNDLADGTWNIGNLANGQTVSIEVTATVNASGIYENTAQVETANEPDPDSDPGNDDGDQSEDDEDAASVEPSAVADLELEKTVDNGTPNVGDNVVFTISVTNDGPSDATGVTVSDQLPTGYTYVSDNQGNDLADGTWNIGNLANGQTVSIEVTATVNASGIYENTAQVQTANEPDPDSDPGNDDGDQSEDDEDAASVEPSAVADLELEKTVDNGTPNVGDNVVFTISVTNDGPSDATGVTVSDQLPTGYTYVSDNQGNDLADGTWNIGNLANGQTVSIEVTATVNASGIYENTAQVETANEPDPDSDPGNDDGDQSEDDEDAASVEPSAVADLELEKTVDNGTPNVGDNVVFTISVTNDGPSDATGVTVSDQLPTGYTYVSDNQGNDLADGTWNIGNLANGQTVSIEVTATVNASGIYENTAQVETANEPDPDSDPGNDDGDQSEDDEDAASVEPSAVADLELEKTVDNGTPNVGDNVVFTISVTNDGPSDATGVTVSDQLPTGYTYVSDNQGNDLADGTWNIGNLANGQTVSIEVTATVNASGIYENTAQVETANEPDPDSDPGNDDGDQSEDDEDAASVEPSAVADLELEKTVDNGTPNVGENIIFTITVTNDGPSDATGVSVEDQLPAGFTYVSDDQGNDLADGIWNIGNLANGATATINVTVTVNASGPYTNVAEVKTANEDDPDSTPDNDNGDQSEDDEDNEPVTPNPIADLELTKDANQSVVNAGGTVIFTINLTNNGPSDATNVAVGDLLPDGFTYISDDPTTGTYDDGTGIWTVGTILSGQTVMLGITATVNATGDHVNVAEVTASDQEDPDSEPDNDDGDQSEDDEDNEEVCVLDIECPADITISCDESDQPENTGTAEGSFTCEGDVDVSFEDEIISGDCANEKTIIRTWTAVIIDTPFEISCEQRITVEDNTAPVLNIPDDARFECTVGNAGTATATDNCDLEPTVTSSDVTNLDNCGLGTITRTWTATDACGNSTSADQIITIYDDTAPELSVPADARFECSLGDAGMATATDNCDQEPTVTFSDVENLDDCGLGTITRTWTATDCAGNSTSADQIITIFDDTAPELSVPADARFECSLGDAGMATATDNCDQEPTVTFSDVENLDNCGLGTITRTWTATDCAGNSTSADQIITIFDDTAPELSVPADARFECSLGDAGMATATDNCDQEPTVTFSDATDLDECGLGTITRTWTATDCAGNSTSADQIITIFDDTAPELSVPADARFECSLGDAGMATATDNCDQEPTVTFSDATDLDECGLGTITRTWTATDCAGNSTSADQIITIFDDTAPELIGVPEDAEASCDEIPEPPVVTANDNCDGPVDVQYVQTDNGGQGFECDPLVITRTWSATDCAGNEVSDSQVITVTDCPQPCDITGITAGEPVCDYTDGTYDIEICVQYQVNPLPDYIEIEINGNGRFIQIPINAPEDCGEVCFTLEDLPADGRDVQIFARIGAEGCSWRAKPLFTAPECRVECDITAVSLLSGPECQGDGTYGACLDITGEWLPLEADDVEIVIGGQTYTPTSWEIVDGGAIACLSGLPANGNPRLDVHVRAGDDCSFTARDLIDAPRDCTGPVCAITAIEVLNATCTDPDPTYDLQLRVTYENEPASGMLNVRVDGNLYQFAITGSPQEVNVFGLTPTGADTDVSASFSANPECSLHEPALYEAPDCGITPPCSIDGVSVVNATCKDNSSYDLQLEITYSNAPTTGTLNIMIDGNLYPRPITGSPQIVPIASLPGTGMGVDVSVSFSDADNCSWTEQDFYIAPDCDVPCDVTDVLVHSAPECNDDGTYSICFFAEGVGLPAVLTDAKIVIAGQPQPVSSYQLTTGGAIICIDNLHADGRSKDVFVQIESGCTKYKSRLYTAPTCDDAPATQGVCSITDVRSVNGWCNGNGTFTQQLEIHYDNAPSSGQLAVSVNGAWKQYNITGSPQTITFDGLPANGRYMHTNVMFTDNQDCSLYRRNSFRARYGCTSNREASSRPLVQREFNIYPNPSSGVLNLSIYNADGNGKAEVEVYNKLGQLVIRQSITENDEHVLNLRQHPEGVYTVRVKGENYVEMKKVVLKF